MASQFYYLSGVAYNDLNGDKSYSKNEGVSGLQAMVRLGGAKSGADGAYSLAVFPGATTITLKDGGLAAPVTVQTNIAADLKLDVIDGDTIATNGSISVSGPIYTIRGLGTAGLTLSGDSRNQTIEGTSGNDTLNGNGGSDLLVGNGGNDLLNGGTGIDIAQYSGKQSAYTIKAANGVVTISGNGEGTDTARGVEVFRFSDGDYAFNAATGALVQFGDGKTGAGPKAVLPSVAFDPKAIVGISGHAYTDKNGNGSYDSGEGNDDVNVQVRLGGANTGADGSYSMNAFAGALTISLTGSGIDGVVTAETILATGSLSLDIVNGNTLVTSGSIKVGGEISTIRGTGDGDLTLIGDFRNQKIIGSNGNDSLFGGDGSDELAGGRGNDRLIGGDGIDTAIFVGNANAYTIKNINGSITVSGNGQGTDTTWGIEVYRFDNGEYIFDPATQTLIPFGENAGPPLAGINNPPVVEAVRSLTTSEGQALAITVAGTDSDGDTITYSAQNPGHGTLTGTGGVYTYTPTAGFTGSDTFTVTLSDGKGGTATQTVHITILEENAAPQVDASQSVATQAGTPVVVEVEGSDPDGDTLSYTAQSAHHGSVQQGDSGSFTYTPTAGFTGTDTFIVTVNDGKGGVATQTVSVTVAEANLAPVVLPSQTAVTEAGDAVSLLIEASDPEGDTLTFTSGSAAHGSAVVNQDGILTYTPNAGFTGADQFNVSVRDGNGGVSTVAVTINVVADGGLPASDFSVTATNGFAGTIGGIGDVFGTNGYQKITLADAHDQLTFDPSFNRGGDTIEFPHSAASYIAYVDGSIVTIQDGDSQYHFPVGANPISLLFADGARSLFVDASTNSVKIGDQVLSDDASLITASASVSGGASQIDPHAYANVTMIQESEVTVDGDYFIFGGTGTQNVFYHGGDVDLDGSFNKGGDIVSLPDPISAYSAYLSGSTLVLVSDDGSLKIPMGKNGITLDFDGVEKIALIDTQSMQIKVGDIAISSTDANNPQPLGGVSLDVGTPGHGVEIDLADDTAYMLSEHADKSSFVTVNGFDQDDQIVVSGAALDDYSFTTLGDDLRITLNDGDTVNQILITDVDASGFVYNAATAETALGWDFITIA